MSNHSVIEHRANYHFLKVEEDFLAICSYGEQSPHCKAMILSVLEHWMNSKRDQDQSEYAYLSIAEWVDQLYDCYGRNTIINCLKELLDEHLILRRDIKRYDQDTYEYSLHVEKIQERIRALPEKSIKEVKPNLETYRSLQEQKRAKREEERKAKEQNEEGSLKINNGVGEKSTSFKNKQPVVQKQTTSRTKGSVKINNPLFKKGHNIDSFPDSSLTSKPSLSPSQDAQDDAVVPDGNSTPEKGKDELSPEQKTRAYVLRQRIIDRCGKLATRGPVINEINAIKNLVQKYCDADIDDVEHYLLHCHFKWSKPDFKFKIRGNVLLEEMEPTLKLFAENPKLRDATSAPSSKPAQSAPTGMTYRQLPPVRSFQVVGVHS